MVWWTIPLVLVLTGLGTMFVRRVGLDAYERGSLEEWAASIVLGFAFGVGAYIAAMTVFGY